jgi:hypothetical protein
MPTKNPLSSTLVTEYKVTQANLKTRKLVHRNSFAALIDADLIMRSVLVTPDTNYRIEHIYKYLLISSSSPLHLNFIGSDDSTILTTLVERDFIFQGVISSPILIKATGTDPVRFLCVHA